ncbi:DNA polymerase-3 subunit beta [Bosea lupini]|uniref:Beta sliding clamp n=1 Tax=Bosea lupini TaxID=1036779 RepID=A0A1H8AH05_9HYPH|nr:DNA polymerase III subunit beta [Bosea lupini]SEM70000.1 DNA polymerase-3 subunit beta [Bosea lupini]
MKLTIERSHLLKAVDPAAKIIQRRNTIPILNNIRIAAEGGEITVTATDLDIEIRSTAPADVETDGAVTVPADQLVDLVRHLPDGSQIGFTLEHDTRLSMRCGRSQARLPTLPASDYPDIAPGEMTHRFELPGETITALLRDTKFAASTEPTSFICGVHWHQVEGDSGPLLAAVATDGSRMLARRAAALPEGANGLPAITIPTRAVSEIARLVEEEKTDVAIALSETKIRVIIGQTLLTSSLIVGGFPDYERAIPKDTPNEVTVEAAPLLAAMKRVAIIADREHIRATVFSFDDRKLTLTMANQASGDLREEVACDFEGEPFAIGYDHRLLTKLLGAIGGDTVLMRIGGESNPNTIFSSHAGSDMYALLARIKG